jgi:hypothetical protein
VFHYITAEEKRIAKRLIESGVINEDRCTELIVKNG